MRTLVEVKTADLIGPALNWAVAKAAEYEPSVYRADGLDGSVSYDIGLPTMSVKKPYTRWSPSTDWSQGGPLIGQCLTGLARMGGEWCAFALEGKAVQIFAIGEGYFDVDAADADGAGDTELIAACRAVVAAKLGDVVQVPAELLERAV